MLVTPILFDNSAIGVCNVYTTRHHRFSNDEQRLMKSLTSMGAVAVQNAHLYTRVFESEETVRKNDRLTTLGMLAAEIAHEIRNPLTVIKLLFESLDLEFIDEDPRHQDVEIIAEKINQLEEIVDRVLEFGRSRTGLHARYDLRDLVERMLRLVRLKLEQSNINLVYDTPEEPLWVEAHVGQLQQVMLNLVFNALQAMPGGGELHLWLGQREDTAGQKQALFHLNDTGKGIDPAIESRIFESFLTGRAGGTGLGLSISKQILKSHRGNLELVGTSDKGTHFCFWLPML